MRFPKILLILAGAIACSTTKSTDAEAVSYDLEPQMVASGVYVFWGKQEPFSRQNGANIVNTGFIVGEEAILVIDAGPTHLYSREMINAIRKISPLPIRFAVITHHHGDHSFGLQTYKKINTNVLMHPDAKALLAQEGSTLFGFLALLQKIRSYKKEVIPRKPEKYQEIRAMLSMFFEYHGGLRGRLKALEHLE